MRRYLSLFIAGCAAFGASVFSISAAAAFGGESLACIVSPSHATAPSSFCRTAVPSPGGYDISYVVQNESGTYTFAWTLPPGSRAAGGCVSTSDYCTVYVVETAADRTLTTSVVLIQGSAQETRSASAFIPAGCGAMLC